MGYLDMMAKRHITGTTTPVRPVRVAHSSPQFMQYSRCRLSLQRRGRLFVTLAVVATLMSGAIFTVRVHERSRTRARRLLYRQLNRRSYHDDLDEMVSDKCDPMGGGSGSSSSSGTSASSGVGIFAYMDTRNAAGTLKRTHVFALTQDGTLAERVTTQIDKWRRSSASIPTKDEEDPAALLGEQQQTQLNNLSTLAATAAPAAAPTGHAWVDGDDDETRSMSGGPLARYQQMLAFTSKEHRHQRVLKLYYLLQEFNRGATQLFARHGISDDTVIPSDHYLFQQDFSLEQLQEAMRRRSSKEEHLLPTQAQLKAIHEQCTRFQGFLASAGKTSDSETLGPGASSSSSSLQNNDTHGVARRTEEGALLLQVAPRDDDDGNDDNVFADSVSSVSPQPTAMAIWSHWARTVRLDATMCWWENRHQVGDDGNDNKDKEKMNPSSSPHRPTGTPRKKHYHKDVKKLYKKSQSLMNAFQPSSSSSTASSSSSPLVSSTSNSNNNLLMMLGTCYEETMTARQHSTRLYELLQRIRAQTQAVQAMGAWQLQNSFHFNALQLNHQLQQQQHDDDRREEQSSEAAEAVVMKPETPQPLERADLSPEKWRLALEMGGLYLGRPTRGKNILQVMHDNDLAAFERDDVHFQHEFSSQLYVAWSLGNETEQIKRNQFYSWWQRNDITGRYGYPQPWLQHQQSNHQEVNIAYDGEQHRPRFDKIVTNGHIRLGKQVCDPPSDCDRPWSELLQAFAETPIVEDVHFEARLPYGETRQDLRFLYPGDAVILEEEAKRLAERQAKAASQKQQLAMRVLSAKSVGNNDNDGSSSDDAAHQNDEEPGDPTLFAYMETSNEDETKRRTHVFALSTKGTLAERVTSKIEKWRTPSDLKGHDDRRNYKGKLEFASPQEREAKVVAFYNLLMDFNSKSRSLWDDHHLFVIRESFGPDFPENNLNLPTQGELNSLLESCIRIRAGVMDHLPKETDEDDLSIDQSRVNLVNDLIPMLESIEILVHQIEANGFWQVRNRFNYNGFKLDEGDTGERPEPLLNEDLHPDRWRLALEMGGLYMGSSRPAGSKNILDVMHSGDFEAFHREKAIHFQQDFTSGLFVVWSLGNETEQNKKNDFYNWWRRNDITGNYGYPWGKWEDTNGHIRLGQQVCDPPTDCDKQWVDLLDEFAETPIVHDIRFSKTYPYGETRQDLRFLYPGDRALLEGARSRKYTKQLRKQRK